VEIINCNSTILDLRVGVILVWFGTSIGAIFRLLNYLEWTFVQTFTLFVQGLMYRSRTFPSIEIVLIFITSIKKINY
jgi:hypothetical protein